MRLKKHIVIFVLLQLCLALNTHAVEENPAACNCETIDISDEEVEQGCNDGVKKEI